MHSLLKFYGLEQKKKKKEKVERNQSSKVCKALVVNCMEEMDAMALIIQDLERETFETFGYSRNWRAEFSTLLQ